MRLNGIASGAGLFQFGLKNEPSELADLLVALTAQQLSLIRQPDGFSALHITARFELLNHIDGGATAEQLSQCVDNERASALKQVIQFGDLNSIKGGVTFEQLLRDADDKNITALHTLLDLHSEPRVTKNGLRNVVGGVTAEQLLSVIDAAGISGLQHAAHGRCLEHIKGGVTRKHLDRVSASERSNILIFAAGSGSLRHIGGGVTAAELGSIIGTDLETGLHRAARHGALDQIEGGVTETELMNYVDECGISALHRAAAFESLHQIRNGITPQNLLHSRSGSYCSALHLAAGRNEFHLVASQLTAPFWEALDPDGDSVAYTAIQAGHSDLVPEPHRSRALAKRAEIKKWWVVDVDPLNFSLQRHAKVVIGPQQYRWKAGFSLTSLQGRLIQHILGGHPPYLFWTQPALRRLLYRAKENNLSLWNAAMELGWRSQFAPETDNIQYYAQSREQKLTSCAGNRSLWQCSYPLHDREEAALYSRPIDQVIEVAVDSFLNANHSNQNHQDLAAILALSFNRNGASAETLGLIVDYADRSLSGLFGPNHTPEFRHPNRPWRLAQLRTPDSASLAANPFTRYVNWPKLRNYVSHFGLINKRLRDKWLLFAWRRGPSDKVECIFPWHCKLLIELRADVFSKHFPNAESPIGVEDIPSLCCDWPSSGSSVGDPGPNIKP